MAKIVNQKNFVLKCIVTLSKKFSSFADYELWAKGLLLLDAPRFFAVSFMANNRKCLLP